MNEKIDNILSEYYEIVVENLNSVKFTPMTKIWFEMADKIINQINIEDLYIPVIPNDIETLKFFRKRKLDDKSNNELSANEIPNNISENVYLNTLYYEKVCLNIKLLTFNSLYPTILIKLIDNNIIKMENNNYYTIFKYLYVNRTKFKTSNNYIVVKLFINYFYGILAGDERHYNKINCKNFHHFDYYKYLLYNTIKKQLNDDLIYFDTDVIYYKGDHQFNFGIPFEIEDVQEFLIFRKKKYIEKIDNVTRFHGFKFA